MRTVSRTTTMQVLLLTAAVTYSGLPWEAAAGFPLDPSRAYLSELAAADQAGGLFFRALDLTTGALVLAAVSMGRMRSAPRSTRVAAVALALFGALTIVDASFPMACASSASLQCARDDAANALGPAHQIHTVSSASALAALLISAVIIAVMVWRSPGIRPFARRLVVIAVVLLVAATVLVSVLALLSTADGHLVTGGGYAQRAQVLLASLYIGGFGFLEGHLHRRPPSGIQTTGIPSTEIGHRA